MMMTMIVIVVVFIITLVVMMMVALLDRVLSTALSCSYRNGSDGRCGQGDNCGGSESLFDKYHGG